MEAIENHLSDTILLDDGFQYARLRRDLDIICIDAAKPFGNGWVIPAGTLREGLGSLKRADIFLITKADLVSSKEKMKKLEKKLIAINPEALIAKAIHRPLYFYKILDEEKVNIRELQNKELALVSAIGSPECFEKTVLRLGLKINKHFIFRDHYMYKKEDMDRINDYCRKNNIDTVISTEKDAVKLEKLFPPRRSPAATCEVEKDAVKLKSLKLTAYNLQLLVLKVRLEIIENEDGFYNRLFGIYSS
jgi:tetraacyldisaccharide 4'-kinase